MKFEVTFSSVGQLREWLKSKNRNSDSAEDYYQWLQNFFDDGNVISVNGEEWDYWACWEII